MLDFSYLASFGAFFMSNKRHYYDWGAAKLSYSINKQYLYIECSRLEPCLPSHGVKVNLDDMMWNEIRGGEWEINHYWKQIPSSCAASWAAFYAYILVPTYIATAVWLCRSEVWQANANN